MSRSIVVSTHLTLAPLHEKYAAELNHIINDNKEFLRPWMPWVDFHPAVENTLTWMRSQKGGNFFEADTIWMILVDGELAGTMGFHRGNIELRTVEIGYWLAEKHNGKGIVTQSVAAMMDYAITEHNANRFLIRTDVNNVKSFGIPERLGYELAGVMPDDILLNGAFHDARWYIHLASNWNGVPSAIN